VEWLVEHLGAMAERQRNAGRTVAGAGIAFPGPVDAQGRVQTPSRMPGWHRYPLAEVLSQRLGMPVTVDNDATLMAVGEHLTARRDLSHLVVVKVGRGIGCGVISAGSAYRGANGAAGDISHVRVDAADERPCSCGNIGCLETVASAPNIVRRARERLFRDRTSSLSRLVIPRDREFTSEDIANAAIAGDDMAQLIMDRTAMYLGIALAGVVNLLNVETVVVGGGVMAAGRTLLDPIIEHTRRRAFGPSFEACRVVAAELGTRAGLIGAALLARDEA